MKQHDLTNNADHKTPLDRVEEFCMAHEITTYHEFLEQVIVADYELAKWCMGGRNISAKTRGIDARITKVKKKLKENNKPS